MSDTFMVNLGERSYPIVFGADLAPEVRAKVAELAKAGRKVAVVTDGHVVARQKAAIHSMFGEAPVWVAPPGEGTKSVAEWGRILEFLAALGMGRTGAVFAVGGGVVGDLAGFVAAAYLRGVDYFQVPTTLLAMVDSSVGGKTGLNLAAGKNLAGAFHQPRGVFVATGLLDTLPPREFAAGMAEAIKCGLLGDGALFAEIERAPVGPASPNLAGVIRRCCEAKARIVEADERELAAEGGRALLNLGHTFGHAIEQAAGYGSYLHGEAVGIGLCAAARLSVRLGLVGSADAERVQAVVAAHALPVRLRAPLSVSALMAAAERDKKSRPEGLRFVVLKRLGEAATRSGVPLALVEACFRELGAA
jgi:3-dehydroquinate synthase